MLCLQLILKGSLTFSSIFCNKAGDLASSKVGVFDTTLVVMVPCAEEDLRRNAPSVGDIGMSPVGFLECDCTIPFPDGNASASLDVASGSR